MSKKKDLDLRKVMPLQMAILDMVNDYYKGGDISGKQNNLTSQSGRRKESVELPLPSEEGQARRDSNTDTQSK